MKNNNDKILVVDFGSQYNHLITRRIRELGVFSELIHFDEIEKKINKDVKGIIFSGGPKSVYDKDAFELSNDFFNKNIPIFGICYGMQYISHKFNGKVISTNNHEYGLTKIDIKNKSEIFEGITKSFNVWMSHADTVVKLPTKFITVASSETTKNAAIENSKSKFYGVQFHPEVNHTENGKKIISNFVFNICKAKKSFDLDDVVKAKIENIKTRVGKDKVVLGLSGGVDSSVTAALISKAIGKQLTCIFVDHGLLRKGESEQVEKAFKTKFNVNFIRVDASKLFLGKLNNVTDPESKRKIIGKLFIDVFNKEAKKIKDVKFLAQGTLYTDIIESGTKTAKTIKSHHNVGGLPEKLKFKLLEPLNDLYKDEVREIGNKIGLEKEFVQRQPFPGPGLAIRIIGSITKEKLKIVQDSDFILREEVKKAKLNTKIWQYFTVLTNTKSVGVKGDNRSYEYVLSIRAVESRDGMTADFYKVPYDVLTRVSTRITNEVKGVSRVVYDITSKPPATIEWE